MQNDNDENVLAEVKLTLERDGQTEVITTEQEIGSNTQETVVIDDIDFELSDDKRGYKVSCEARFKAPEGEEFLNPSEWKTIFRDVEIPFKISSIGDENTKIYLDTGEKDASISVPVEYENPNDVINYSYHTYNDVHQFEAYYYFSNIDLEDGIGEIRNNNTEIVFGTFGDEEVITKIENPLWGSFEINTERDLDYSHSAKGTVDLYGEILVYSYDDEEFSSYYPVQAKYNKKIDIDIKTPFIFYMESNNQPEMVSTNTAVADQDYSDFEAEITYSQATTYISVRVNGEVIGTDYEVVNTSLDEGDEVQVVVINEGDSTDDGNLFISANGTGVGDLVYNVGPAEDPDPE